MTVIRLHNPLLGYNNAIDRDAPITRALVQTRNWNVLSSAFASPAQQQRKAKTTSSTSTALKSQSTKATSTPEAQTSTPSSSSSSDTALRILALGDSIAYGFNESPGNSYRRYLQCSLSTSGRAATYIGTTTNGDWSNNANDGYVSQEITAISTSADYILSQTPSANLILLHAGSNDVLHNVDVTNAPERLGTLIDKIHTQTGGAAIVVAQIISLGEGYTKYNTALETFNAAIPAVVAERVAKGMNVVVVDMQDVVAASDLVDGIHPVAAGYQKMAAKWLTAIEGLSGVVNVTGAYTDEGSTAVPSSGSCADLAA